MRLRAKPESASKQIESLQASASDYLVLAAAVAVPLYASGLSVLQPAIGVIFVMFAWLGLSISYFVRLMGVKPFLARNTGWIFLGVALFIAFNYQGLNSRLPAGGFDWHMAPASFLCWFVVIASYFLWTDDGMLFLLVPGIALFGVQSYIESNSNFELSLILFMVSVAVLLTRLHFRTMYAAARAAGYSDLHALYAGPWKAVAGPFLAIISVLVVAAASFLLAPGLGGAVRTLAGDPEIKFEPATARSSSAGTEGVSRRIGGGPMSSSNLVILKVKTDGDFPYLRGHPLQFYHHTGWTEDTSANTVAPSENPPESKLPDVTVYDFSPPPYGLPKQTASIEVQSVNRPHLYAYSPGWPERLEYDGNISLYMNEFPVLTDIFMRGKQFYLRAALQTASPIELRRAKPTDRRIVADYYRARSRDLVTDKVRQLAQTIADRQPTDYDVVEAFISEIDNRCKYNLKAERIEGDQDRVEAFLFDTHEGYCDLFASSLTVMCRSVGLRARLMTGFIFDKSSKQGDGYLIRDRDAHMWTEVFFEGIGWLPFDATERAQMVPGGERGALLVEEDTSGTLAWAAWVGGSIFTLAALALIVGWFLSWYSGRKSVAQELKRLRPLYFEFLRLLQSKLRRPKQPGETLAEYARAFAIATSNGADAQRVAAAFDNAFYAQDLPVAEHISDIKDKLDDLIRTTKQNGH